MQSFWYTFSSLVVSINNAISFMHFLNLQLKARKSWNLAFIVFQLWSRFIRFLHQLLDNLWFLKIIYWKKRNKKHKAETRTTTSCTCNLQLYYCQSLCCCTLLAWLPRWLLLLLLVVVPLRVKNFSTFLLLVSVTLFYFQLHWFVSTLMAAAKNCIFFWVKKKRVRVLL